ncbi:hypothetical protein P9112_007940 [Eukaryota sp. TZLM1-RC]
MVSLSLTRQFFSLFVDILKAFDVADQRPLYVQISRYGVRFYSSYASVMVARADFRRDLFVKFEVGDETTSFGLNVGRWVELVSVFGKFSVGVDMLIDEDAQLVTKLVSEDSVHTVSVTINTLDIEEPVLDLGFDSSSLKATAAAQPPLMAKALAQLSSLPFQTILSFNSGSLKIDCGSVCVIRKSPHIDALAVTGSGECSFAYRGDLFRKALKPLSKVGILHMVRVRVDESGILQVLYFFKALPEGLFFEISLIPEVGELS